MNIIDDLQILTGKNDGSPVARKPLNKMLQQVLNPDGERIQGNPFRVNDKIVDLKNGKYPDGTVAEENWQSYATRYRIVSNRKDPVCCRSNRKRRKRRHGCSSKKPVAR